MAATFVQGAQNSGSANTVTYSAANVAGNFLVVAAVTYNAAGGTPTDTTGNTWTLVADFAITGGSDYLNVWYAANCKAGTNTVTVSGAMTALFAVEYSNVPTSSSVDASVFSTALSQTVTTTALNDVLIFIAANTNNSSTSWTNPSGSTQREVVLASYGGTPRGMSLWDLPAATIGSYTVTTGTGSGGGPAASVLIAIKSLVIPAGAYSYYRLLIWGAGGDVACCTEWKFYDSTSTQIATTTGTASASDSYSGQPPSYAFDGNTSTFWDGASTVTNTAPGWLQYQFTSPVTVASFSIMTRPDGFYFQGPSSFALQGSNNGSTWITLGIYGTAWTVASQLATYNVGVGLSQAYRLLITAANGPLSIAEWAMFDVNSNPITISNGANGGSGCSNIYYRGAQGSPFAFDGSGSTFWICPNNPTVSAPEWLSYRFSTPHTLGSFTIQNRVQSQAPTAFQLQTSPDGVTWTTIQNYTATWSSDGQTKTFTTPIPRGNISSSQIQLASRQGTGTQIQMFGGGSVTTGHVAAFDANGNIIDSGGTGGGGGTTVTALPPYISVAGILYLPCYMYAVTLPVVTGWTIFGSDGVLTTTTNGSVTFDGTSATFQPWAYSGSMTAFTKLDIVAQHSQYLANNGSVGDFFGVYAWDSANNECWGIVQHSNYWDQVDVVSWNFNGTGAPYTSNYWWVMQGLRYTLSAPGGLILRIQNNTGAGTISFLVSVDGGQTFHVVYTTGTATNSPVLTGILFTAAVGTLVVYSMAHS